MIPDSPHSLRDAGGRRWPVIDGIPFLRVGREPLAAAVLARLDAGDALGGTALLLADQDDWWQGPSATPADLERLVRDRGTLSLREAMRLLAWGPVAEYFAHRWSDPTFLSGLALTEAHWRAPATAFELACGIGHHLRALARAGVAVTGADVVFAKLWVARHWVVPEATLLCFDAAHDWPPAPTRFDLVACHDAFYFLEPKAAILARLRERLTADGVLLVGHVHNRARPNFSAGHAVSAEALAVLFPDGQVYDDAEPAAALLEGRVPRIADDAVRAGAEAFAVAAGPGVRGAARPDGGLVLPPTGTALWRNPLYDDAGVLAFPSERYAAEYGPHATYPPRTEAPAAAALGPATAHWALRRELLDLPERW